MKNEILNMFQTSGQLTLQEVTVNIVMSAMLEMKQKQGVQQLKRSLKISREDAVRIIKGDLFPLLTYRDPFAAEIYAFMQIHAYRPVTIVEYRRKAFIAKENKIRITFDNQIVATESSFDLFDPNLNMK